MHLGKLIRPEDLVRSLSQRMPWHVGRAVLRVGGSAPSRNWEQTIPRLLDDIGASPEFFSYLCKAYLEHILCGEKSIRLYELERQDIDAAIIAAKNIACSGGPFSAMFPAALADEPLSQVTPYQFFPTRVIDTESGVAVIFCSQRYHEERVEIDPADITDDSALNDFHELIGIRRSKKQAFDVIWLPKNGSMVEIRVDETSLHNRDAATGVHLSLLGQAKQILSLPDTSTPVNVFGAIRNLYDAKGEGSVVEMGFTTTTASVKHEKMRRQKLCLREEIYHIAGFKAVSGDIQPYTISVRWHPSKDDENSTPELSIMGSMRILHAEQPFLDEFSIRRCWGVEDFEFVRNKLLSLL